VEQQTGLFGMFVAEKADVSVIPKLMKELKTSTNDSTAFLDWLKTNEIYLEADTLGRKTTHMLGYLFFLQLQVIHHISLIGIIHEAITDICLLKSEVEDINPNALKYYPYILDDTQEQITEMTDKEQDNSGSDNSKLVPIPFELYWTDVGYGTDTDWVAIKAISIKSNVEYGKLLNKLLLHMQIGKHTFLNEQYIPIELATRIGTALYTQLICDKNAYILAIASIPVLGINDSQSHYPH